MMKIKGYYWSFLVILILLSYIENVRANEMTVGCIRHVESAYNANTGLNKRKALHFDSKVSKNGEAELLDILKYFGKNILKKTEWKDLFKTVEFHWEASNLRRAMLTLIAAMKSLYDAADDSLKTTLLSKSFIVNDLLQEIQTAFLPKLLRIQMWDAITKFKGKWFKDEKTRKEFMDYLARAVPKSGTEYFTSELDIDENGKSALWNGLFRSDTKFKEGFEAKLEHKSFHSLNEYDVRIKTYGKYLRKQLNSGVKLIVIGGHSHFFKTFFAKFATKEIHEEWIEKGAKEDFLESKEKPKIKNGNMAKIVIEPAGTDSIKIKSIEAAFNLAVVKKQETTNHKAKYLYSMNNYIDNDRYNVYNQRDEMMIYENIDNNQYKIGYGYNQNAILFIDIMMVLSLIGFVMLCCCILWGIFGGLFGFMIYKKYKGPLDEMNNIDNTTIHIEN